MKLPDKILIYGLGLMGASISLTLQKSSPCTEISGIVKTEEEVEIGKGKKSADIIMTEEKFLQEANFNNYGMIIFALPVNLTIEKIKLLPRNYTGYITDICSVKNGIMEYVNEYFGKDHKYISSHPMTGSEETGLVHANSELYTNKLCIINIPENVEPGAVEYIQNFWRFIGMETYIMDVAEHDRIMAYVSHVPHILSSIMTNWVESCGEVRENTLQSDIPLAGGGFRDMVRIAGSNPEMWEAIINSNKNEIKIALEKFKLEIAKLLEVLEKEPEFGYWKDYFKKAKTARNSILKNQ